MSDVQSKKAAMTKNEWVMTRRTVIEDLKTGIVTEVTRIEPYPERKENSKDTQE